MRRLKILVEYDGTGLVGWQKQNNGPSVQGHLEDAVSRMVGTPTEIVGCSRTDAGVHALNHVSAFSTEKDIPTLGFLRGLNTYLPPSISIRECIEVDPSFHPRFESLGKTYRYKILIDMVPSPLLHHRAWRRKKPLDIVAMQEASAALIGEHDFSAFRASGCGAKHPIRAITSIDILENGRFVEVLVKGNAFLRHMVRIITGTLVEIGEGTMEVSAAKHALESKQRSDAGITAPPQGLYLEEVHYP